jgi:hypothetical protein
MALSPEMDSLSRREQLIDLALAFPTSKDPEYDREYYTELRQAHRPYLTLEDLAQVQEVEELVARRMSFSGNAPRMSAA